jgi:hypothetical protein
MMFIPSLEGLPMKKVHVNLIDAVRGYVFTYSNNGNNWNIVNPGRPYFNKIMME